MIFVIVPDIFIILLSVCLDYKKFIFFLYKEILFVLKNIKKV